MPPLHVMVVLGTRPEAIKLAPVIHRLREQSHRFETTVCVTAQHRQLLDQALSVFDIRPDIDLNLMTRDQSLTELTARILTTFGNVLDQRKPECILVQGDTTTVMACALAAFYRRVQVGHVEAGLRTDNKFSPFPEEINRRLATQLSDYHFAPTEGARQRLLREGVAPETIHVTGNTVIDALLMARDKTRGRRFEWGSVTPESLEGRRVVAITGHRRENFGEGFLAICRAIRRLAERFGDVSFIYPVHLNPNVQAPVFAHLGSLPNVHLIEPLDYLPFVALMERSCLILTDSGGVQEEAPSLGRPVLVMRDTTERPEAIEAGTARLVGAREDTIYAEAARLLEDAGARETMSRARNPFGDGHAAERIVKILDHSLR